MQARILAEESESKPWGDVILASVLVWLLTFTGLLLSALTGCFKQLRHNHVLNRLLIPSFATGALLATCVFLLIPESLELMAQAAAESAASQVASESEEFHTLNGTDSDLDHDDVRRKLEETHEGEIETEHGFAWKFGAAVLGGFLFPILLHALIPSPQKTCEECKREEMASMQEIDLDDVDRGVSEVDSLDGRKTVLESCDTGECKHKSHAQNAPLVVSDIAAPDKSTEMSKSFPDEAPEQSKKPHSSLDIPLAISIIVGDFLHNFTDGIFIGTAFLLCSRDIGFTLVATTIYHEIAQELADFVVLTSHCGLPVWKAVVANAISGLSVMLGAVIVLAADMSENAIGVILAISAGVYIYITACECIPRIMSQQESQKEIFLFALVFAIGAVPIGLVLLNHGHCHGHEESHDHETENAANTTRWLEETSWH